MPSLKPPFFDSQSTLISCWISRDGTVIPHPRCSRFECRYSCNAYSLWRRSQVVLGRPFFAQGFVGLVGFVLLDSHADLFRVYNTGGTIVSSSNYSRLDNIEYGLGPVVTPQNLIGNYSEVLKVAQIAVINFPAPGGSAGINSSLYLNVSQWANRQLCSKDSDIAGAIMFHGTNTLEETVSSQT